MSFDDSENNCTEESYIDEIKTEKTAKNAYSNGTWKVFSMVLHRVKEQVWVCFS
jgi:hypothetical protein